MKLFIPNYKTLRDLGVLVNRLMIFSVRVVHCLAVRTPHLGTLTQFRFHVG
jgi:hypothetical protein